MLSIQIAFGLAIFAAALACVTAWNANKPFNRDVKAYFDRRAAEEKARKAALPKRDIISWIAQNTFLRDCR